MDNSLIEKYFPGLTELQKEQYKALDELYHDWNSKINVISRKDIDNLYLHHVLLSAIIQNPEAHLLGIGGMKEFDGTMIKGRTQPCLRV